MNSYKIYLDGYEPIEVVRGIDKNLEQYNPHFDFPEENTKAFSPEIALIVISGITAISPIIKALLHFFKKKEPATIKINSKDGNSIEFPSNLSNEELEKYISILEKINLQSVVISKAKK